MEGRQQLPLQEIPSGRKIATLRIYIERAIGRMKLYSIQNSTIPVSLSHFSNQIILCTSKEKHSLTRKLVGYRDWTQRWCKKEVNKVLGKEKSYT